MKRILSLLVVVALLLTSFTIPVVHAEVIEWSQDASLMNANDESGITYKLTSDIGGTLTLTGQEIAIDLAGHTWQHNGTAIILSTGSIHVYDSVGGGTINVTASDAINMGNGTALFENITIKAGGSNMDAIFCDGGNLTVNNCTLSGPKAGINVCNSSEAADASARSVVTVNGGTFANYDRADKGIANCAIEIRNNADEITLNGDIKFENNKILSISGNTKSIEEAITIGADAVAAYTAGATITENSRTWNTATIAYTCTSCEGESGTTSGVPGDLNGDDQTNAKDVTVIRRYIADGEPIADESIYDLDQNDIVNAKDVTALRRYISDGWEIELPTPSVPTEQPTEVPTTAPTEAPTAEPTQAPVTEAPADPTELPKEANIVDGKLVIADLPSCGSFTDAGFDASQKLLNFQSGGENSDVSHSIGIIDLSKYKEIIITYGNDGSVSEVGLLVLKTATEDLVSMNLNVATGWKNFASTTFDVSALNNKEELFLALASVKAGFAVTEIKFVPVDEGSGEGGEVNPEEPEEPGVTDPTANEVTSIDQFLYDGTINKLTSNITGMATVDMNAEKGNLVVDLNGYTWENSDKIIDLITGTVSVYDSSEAKTGTMKSTGNDAVSMGQGEASFKDITIIGGPGGADAIFVNGGTVTVENCTLSAGKAGFNAANDKASVDEGYPVKATIIGGKFALYGEGADARNCAIELRNNASNITLSGDITFENNVIIGKAASTVAIKDAITAAEGYTVTFTAGSNVQDYVTATVDYKAESSETPEEPEIPCEHSFTNYVSNNDATTEADGTKTATCDKGCGATDTIVDEGSKLPSEPVEPTDNEVTSVDQILYNGTVNKLTADIEGTITVNAGQNVLIDLNGHKWTNGTKVIDLNGGTISVYDSSEAKTGTITATGDDTINIQSGNATFKDITVYGAVDSADAIFILGGNVTVENCTVSSGKAGINVDNRNGNAVVNVKGGKFANYTDSKDASGRNCAIELRNNASNVTLSGDITFETNVIISKAASTVAIKDAITAGEGYTVTFTAGNNISDYVTATVDYKAESSETPEEPDVSCEHVFSHYVSNNDATYEKDGTKSAFCDYGCGTIDTKQDVGSKLTIEEDGSSNKVTRLSNLKTDGTVNKFTSDINGSLTVSGSQNIVIDLAGHNWTNNGNVIVLSTGNIKVYDSVGGGAIISNGNDAVNMGNGTATFENVTITANGNGMDAIYCDGGKLTVTNCVLSGSKAGVNVANGSEKASAEARSVVTINGGVFANYTGAKDSNGRNCAIEIRNNADEITLNGNIDFENNLIISQSSTTTKAISAAITCSSNNTATYSAGKTISGYSTAIIKLTSNVNMSELPSKGTFTAAGYASNQYVLNYNSGGSNNGTSHSLGMLDLREVEKVVVHYGTDASVSSVGAMWLKTKDEYALTAKKTLTKAKGWKDTTTTVTFDVSSLRYNEEIFLAFDYINGVVVNKIELVLDNDTGVYPFYSTDSSYVCGSGEDVSSYFEKSYNDYLNACEYYTNKGFTIYNQNEKNGNHFTTLVNGSKMAHIYWIACESELNVIYSDTNGANLPPQKPAVTTGSYKTTVTQIKGNGSDVTGYIYQLADGSFIIYDGGNAACADEIKNTLTALSGGKEIIVRAWVLTVAESNNYGAFSAFASKYASSIKLETIITAPISEKISSPVSKTYLTSTFKTDAAKFSGAKVCYAHTGMDFTFCNVKMEILFTAEEQYICDVPRVENGSTEAAEFRNTSLVSRIVTDNCNVMMLSNIGLNSARRMAIYYRDYLKSDICQMAENGLGDLSMYIYNVIGAPTLFCPATTNTFNTNTTNKTVRDTLAKSVATKKIILLDSAENTIVLDDVVKRDTSASENFTGALDPSTLTVGYEYTCFNADKMYYYFDITVAQAKGVMAYYATNGYEAYSTFIGNGNYAATYTKGSEMIHMYWYEIENRMTIVKSPNGANTLPDKALANITGSFETSVTQLKSKQINGMGYVIQLEDGSFIIYDGGYRDTTDKEILAELWGTLNDLTPDGNKIIIRAWIITHPHGDHYGTFINFCNTYAKNVTLETMIVNQITEEVRSMQTNDGYLQKYLAADVAKFEGAVICNVYPGMVFDFGSLRMEILGTHHDAFILSTPKGTSNNTCVVSRLITENDQMLLLADAGVDQMEPMAAYFGDYLKSTNCQVSHHGVEDCPLIVYRHIKAARLWYPCDTYLYNLTDRDADVRKALKESKYTEEILLHDLTRKTRTLG